jgi:hypothetical protein
VLCLSNYNWVSGLCLMNAIMIALK